MRKTLATLIVTLLAGLGMTLTTGLAHAEGDAKHGGVLANTCMGCHGIDGYRNAYPSYRVPKLGGQHADYIVIALQGYKNQTRAHGTMHAQVASLSDQDMRDIAAFFASEGQLKAGPAVVTAGKDKTATCAACHGEQGVSAAPNWPSLAGQHLDYIQQALHQYQNGQRKDPVMSGLVAALSEQDIHVVAAYFAAQPGLFTVTYAH